MVWYLSEIKSTIHWPKYFGSKV